MPWLIGGAADLAPSTKTRLTFEGAGDFEAGSYAGRNFHFGIREHAMGAICNGMSLSKVRPFGAGFLIFSDYARGSDPAVRAHGAARHPRLHPRLDRRRRRRARRISRSSSSPRCGRCPSLMVLRPADANEVVEAWRVILPLQHQPVALILTPPGAADVDRATLRRRVRRGPGRLRPRRRARRHARGAAARHRQRGGALRRGVRAARRGGRQGARRQHAVVGALRAAVAGVPRPRPSARRPGARLGRAGGDVRLGALYGRSTAPASAWTPSAPPRR